MKQKKALLTIVLAFVVLLGGAYALYDRLDSNQRPSESELSGGQWGNHWGAVVSSILHNLRRRIQENWDSLRRNDSRFFRRFSG